MYYYQQRDQQQQQQLITTTTKTVFKTPQKPIQPQQNSFTNNNNNHDHHDHDVAVSITTDDDIASNLINSNLITSNISYQPNKLYQTTTTAQQINLYNQNLNLKDKIFQLQEEIENLVKDSEMLFIENKDKNIQIIKYKGQIREKDRYIQDLILMCKDLEDQINLVKGQVHNLQQNKGEDQNELSSLSTIKQEDALADESSERFIVCSKLTYFSKESRQSIYTQTQFNNNNVNVSINSFNLKDGQHSSAQCVPKIQKPNPGFKNNESELSPPLKKLTKQLNQERKVNNQYKKRIDRHQEQIKKYQLFIQQLSSEIALCQDKIRTEQQQNQAIKENIKAHKNIQKDCEDDQTNIRRYFNAQKLNDINKLIKQLSQAYDKILELTFENNHLKNGNQSIEYSPSKYRVLTK